MCICRILSGNTGKLVFVAAAKNVGEQAVFNLAEVAFVAAYDRKYFGDLKRNVSGKKQRVIPKSLYQELGFND